MATIQQPNDPDKIMRVGQCAAIKSKYIQVGRTVQWLRLESHWRTISLPIVQIEQSLSLLETYKLCWLFMEH